VRRRVPKIGIGGANRGIAYSMLVRGELEVIKLERCRVYLFPSTELAEHALDHVATAS